MSMFSQMNTRSGTTMAHGRERLQVLRQLGAAGVARVHRDVGPDRAHELDLLVHEEELLDVRADGVQHRLVLGRDDAQHLDTDAVELVEAAPGTRLGQPHEDVGHGEVRHLVGAVEHHDRETDRTGQVLRRLGLPGPRRASRSTTQDQVAGLRQRDVAAVRQRGDHKAPAVAHILEEVQRHPVADLDDARLLGIIRDGHQVDAVLQLARRLHAPVEAQLRLPLERGLVLQLQLDILVDHVAPVHVDGDDRDDLHAQVRTEVGLHLLDERNDAVVAHALVVLHRALAAALEVVEGARGLLGPHDLRDHQGELAHVVPQPDHARVVDLPVLRGVARVLQDVAQHRAEVRLEAREVGLHSAVQGQVLVPRHGLRVLGVVPAGDLPGVRRLAEVQRLHAVEAVAHVLRHLERLVAVGQDVQQRLVRHEVEAREGLLLLLEVVVQRLLAGLDRRVQAVQDLLTALGAADLHAVDVRGGVHHQVLPLESQRLEALGLVRQLRADIVREHEDRLEARPVGLDLLPHPQHGLHGAQLERPLVHHGLAELDEAAHADHAHHLQRVALEHLDDLAQVLEERAVLAAEVEGELHLLPRGADHVQLLLDLRLLRGLVHGLGHVVREVVQLQVQQVLEAELRALLEGLARHRHDLLPVAITHGIGVEVVHQREHRGHLLDLLRQPVVQLPRLQLLRHALHLRHEILGAHHHVVRVDLVPERRVPVVEGRLDQRDGVPQVLQQHQVLVALLQLAVARHRDVEEPLQVVVLTSTRADILRLRLVRVDRGVRIPVVELRHEGALLAELLPVLLHLHRELVDLVADLPDLLRAQREDHLLHVEGYADHLVPLRRGLVQGLQALVGKHAPVLLERHHLLADRVEHLLHRLHRELHVPVARHDRVQQVRVVRLVHRALVHQTATHLQDEVADVVEQHLRVRAQEVRVLRLPLLRELDERHLDGRGVHAQPVDVDRRLELLDALAHVRQLDDLRVERVHRRRLQAEVHANQVHDLGKRVAVVVLVLDQVARALREELVESLRDGVRPEEGVLHEGLAVLHALRLRVVDELRDEREQALHLEVLLDLVQVVPGLRVHPLHRRGHGEEVLQPALQDAAERVAELPRRGVEGRLEDDLLVLQLDLHVEERLHLVAGNDERVQDLAQVLQRDCDGRHEALDDDVVHELDVVLPDGGHLAHLQRLRGVLDELVDLLALLGHLVQLHAHGALVLRVELLRSHRLGLALQQRLLAPLGEDGGDLPQVALDHIHHAAHVADHLLGLRDERRDLVVRAPLELREARGEVRVHLGDTVLEERLLHREQLREHRVVLLHNDVQLADPRAVGVHAGVHVESTFRQLDLLAGVQQEVPDLAQQARQERVEVHAEQAGLVHAAQQPHLELLARRVHALRLPRLVLVILEGVDRLDHRPRRLLDLAELLRDLAHLVGVEADLGHRLLQALAEGVDPVDRACHRRHVAVDRRRVLVLRDRVLVVLQDVLQLHEVVLVLREQERVLALELVLQDRALQQALEVVEQLQALLHRVEILEAVRQHRRQAAVQLLHRAAELEEVVVELLLLDVHDVVRDLLEAVHGGLELLEDRLDLQGQDLPLRPADLHALELEVLHDGAREVQDVPAALAEHVQAREEGRGLDLPAAGALLLRNVLEHEVRLAELVQDAQRLLQLRHGLEGLVVLDRAEDHRAGDEALRLRNDRVADHADEDAKTHRRVVVLRVLPDKQDVVEDRLEELAQLEEVRALVADLLEERVHSLEELHVVVGVLTRVVHLALQLAERVRVRGLVLLQELQDLLHPLVLQLGVDRVQVLGLVLPEAELHGRLRVQALLERLLRILVEHVTDLLRPRDHRALQHVHAVLAVRGVRGRLLLRKRKQRLALHQARGHVQVGQVHVVLVHQVLADQVRPATLVRRIAQDRKVHGVADDVQDVHRLLRELQKDQGVRVVFVRDVALVRSTVHHEALALELRRSRRLARDLHQLAGRGVQEHARDLGLVEEEVHSACRRLRNAGLEFI